jgi:nucleoside permease NupC
LFYGKKIKNVILFQKLLGYCFFPLAYMMGASDSPILSVIPIFVNIASKNERITIQKSNLHR